MLSLYLKCSNCKLKNKYDAEYCKNCEMVVLKESEIETSVIKNNINSKSLFIGIVLILISSFFSIVDFNNREDEIFSWGLTTLSGSFNLIIYYIFFNFLSNFKNSYKVLVALKYLILTFLFSNIFYSFSIDFLFKNLQLSSYQESIRDLNYIIYFLISFLSLVFSILFLIRLLKFKDEFIGLFKYYSIGKLVFIVIYSTLLIIDSYFGDGKKNYTMEIFQELLSYIPQVFLILIFIKGMIFANSK